MVAKEIQETLREITMLGFGIILICHSKEKASSYTDEEGNPISSVEPDLSKNVYTVANAVCDLIAYIGIEFDKDGKPHRYLYTRQTPTIFAGARWKYLEPKIEFGYKQLVDAIGKAIDLQRTKDGATVVEHQERASLVSRPFNEVMEEAKSVWNEYLGRATNDEEKERNFLIMKETIRKVFGNEEFKLSQATPGQQDLVELFIDEMRQIMM